MVPCSIEIKIVFFISLQRAQKVMVSSGHAVLRWLASIRVIFSTWARQLIRADAPAGRRLRAEGVYRRASSRGFC